MAATMIAQTLAAVPASTHTPSPIPEPTTTWTATPEETAPDPLPVQNTGITLQNGECYDLDTGDAPYVMDADCDILSTVNQELLPQNGALLSGYADMNPPTRSECMLKEYASDHLVAQSDLYLCFVTSEGDYGFLVGRQDSAPFEIYSTRLIFDYWVFH